MPARPCYKIRQVQEIPRSLVQAFREDREEKMRLRRPAYYEAIAKGPAKFAVFHGNEPVGFIVADPWEKMLSARALYVRPEHRGTSRTGLKQSAGETLAWRLIRHAQKQGLEGVAFDGLNAAATSLLTKLQAKAMKSALVDVHFGGGGEEREYVDAKFKPRLPPGMKRSPTGFQFAEITHLPESMAHAFARAAGAGHDYMQEVHSAPVKVGAFQNGRLVGFYTAEPFHGRLSVSSVFVEGENRRKKLGSQLAWHAISRAQEAGMHGVNFDRLVWASKFMLDEMARTNKVRGIKFSPEQDDDAFHYSVDFEK